MPTELSERLAEVARRENNSVSAVARRLLSSQLDREDASQAATRKSREKLRT
jgi:predicted transcriptional regulator